jgi:hypothetical protein
VGIAAKHGIRDDVRMPIPEIRDGLRRALAR